MISKDVLICDWHYERADLSAVYFAMKGLPVVSCGYRNPEISVQQVKDMMKFRAQAPSGAVRAGSSAPTTGWAAAVPAVRIRPVRTAASSQPRRCWGISGRLLPKNSSSQDLNGKRPGSPGPPPFSLTKTKGNNYFFFPSSPPRMLVAAPRRPDPAPPFRERRISLRSTSPSPS